jgi:hypothetical protein
VHLQTSPPSSYSAIRIADAVCPRPPFLFTFLVLLAPPPLSVELTVALAGSTFALPVTFSRGDFLQKQDSNLRVRRGSSGGVYRSLLEKLRGLVDLR